MLKKINLATKIGGGFGVVILLLVIISLVSWKGLSGVSDEFVTYRGLAKNTNLSGRLQANMLMIRMNVKDYIITQSGKDIEDYHEYFDKMNGFLDQAKKEIQDPDRAAVIAEFAGDVKKYNEIFNQVIGLFHERDRLLKDVLVIAGPQIEKNLTIIMESAKKDSDAEATYEAGTALRHLLLGRLYAQKFLDTNAALDKERVEGEFAELSAGLESLSSMLQNQQRRKLNEDSVILANEYVDAFLAQEEVIRSRNELIENKLDKMGPKMAADVETVKLSIKEEQDILGPLVQSQCQTAIRVILFVSLAAFLIGLLAAFFITKTITGPVQKVVTFVEYLSSGDFTSKLDNTQEDEIGKMSQALDKTAVDLGLMIKDIILGVNTLASSSTELSAIATQLSGNAEEASQRSSGVASAAEEMSSNMNSVSAAMEQSASNVGMVATAAEEMSATVNEIAQNTARAKNISEEAVVQSHNTSEKISELGQAAGRIGKVTEAITEISEQTNLLALNATIEAARAGEAGKGFAVVANEIKDLAKQTAEATVDIKNQIEGMQNTTSGTISDIEKIGEVINEINEVITTIASAVEEQSAATLEISDNVSQAAQGISEVNENVAQSSTAVADITKEIAGISTSSEEVNSGSDNVKGSATELSKLAEQLDGMVKKFKINDQDIG